MEDFASEPEYRRAVTEYACARCGYRAELALALARGPYGKSNAAWQVGLTACPNCGARDRKLLALAAAVPALGGALFGSLAFLAAWIGLTVAAAQAGKGSALTTAIPAAIVGLAVAALVFRSKLRRALAEGTSQVIGFGEQIVDPIGDGPYRTPAAKPRSTEPLGKPLLFGMPPTEAAYSFTFAAAAGLGALQWLWDGAFTPTIVALCIAIGAVAGVIRARGAAARAAAIVSLGVCALGIVYALHRYLDGRSIVVRIELLLPVGLGALPGLALDQLTARLIGRANYPSLRSDDVNRS